MGMEHLPLPPMGHLALPLILFKLHFFHKLPPNHPLHPHHPHPKQEDIQIPKQQSLLEGGRSEAEEREAECEVGEH